VAVSPAQTSAVRNMHEASAELKSIRDGMNAYPELAEDETTQVALTIALKRFRDACATYTMAFAYGAEPVQARPVGAGMINPGGLPRMRPSEQQGRRPIVKTGQAPPVRAFEAPPMAGSAPNGRKHSAGFLAAASAVAASPGVPVQGPPPSVVVEMPLPGEAPTT
jgi:hypothetical protein